MNLIEQLGGYEKALDLFRGCPWDSGTVDVPNPRSKGMLRLDLSDLSYELLKYRREHNIFEVGDKVVYLPRTSSNIPFIQQNVCTITGLNIEGMISLIFGSFPISRFKHATDDEIKVGHRI